MVYWHIETDFVALAIYIVLFIKAAVLNRQKDMTDKIFGWSLVLGFVSTVIDVLSSTIMNERMGWWLYEIGMIIYGLSVPLLPLFWFLYTVSLIYKGSEKATRSFITVFCGMYAAYALVIITNPIHELYFHLTPDIVYSRGNWFIPLIVGSQCFLSAMAILLMLVKHEKVHSRAIFFLLLFLHFVTAVSYFVQLAHPGWLIVCSTYALAFLVCDATFESQRRDTLYKTIKTSYELLQADKERKEAYERELEKAVREATQANQVKSEFLSRMSHDIRTPINGIRGMLGIIRKERYDEQRVDDCLDKIEMTSGHLLSLINDVLDMSKLESGEIELAREPFDLNTLISDCFSVLSQTAADSGVTLEYTTKSELSFPRLIGSPLHLRQIFLNIIGNAIKYNRRGGMVYCSAEETGHDDDTVTYRFAVRDTGIGMSPEFLPQVFQPFAQEHIGSRTKYEGTGLGLAIVKEMIEKMGGDIYVESELDVGSEFTFTLPFTIDKTVHDENEEAESAAEENISLAGVRVLLVEDNELNLEIAQYILEDAGAEVDTAENGQEAVDKVAASADGYYNAILMDVVMPVMDGIEATKCIREMERPDARRIPILAMTANAFSEDVKKCLDAGMNAHLAKPLDAQIMLKKTAYFIADRRKDKTE